MTAGEASQKVCNMPDRAVDTENSDVAMEALNEIMEAWLAFSGNKQSRQFLRALAARLASTGESENIVPMRPPPRKPERTLAAKAWLQQRLPGWLARHG